MLVDDCHISVFQSRYPKSKLVDAVCLNELDEVSALLTELEQAAEVPSNKEDFHRAYYHCVRLNRVLMVQEFLEYGASAIAFSERFYYGYIPKDPMTRTVQTPLMLAALSHHPDLMRLLHSYGALPPSIYTGCGVCLLSQLAKRHHPHVQATMAVLVDEMGADVNQKSGCDFASPLHRACQYGKPSVVEFLLSRGADPNSTNAFGDTPLMLVTAHQHNNIPRASTIIQLLTSNGAKLQIANHDGTTALHIACTGAGACTVKAYLLLEFGAPMNARDRSGSTPLLRATCTENADDLVALLLSFGADPNIPCILRYHALHFAARDNSRLGATKALLKHGANPKVRDSVGFTPLEMACNQCQLDSIFVLFRTMYGLGQIHFN